MSIESSAAGHAGAQVAVVGAGAWGTTIANLIASAGRPCVLITQTRDQAERISDDRENVRYLPSIRLDERLVVTDELAELTNASLVVVVVPSQRMRAAAEDIASVASPDAVIISCAKGLELGSLKRMTDVLIDAGGFAADRVCALSGPNLAREIAVGLPASAVVASASGEAAKAAQQALSTPTFRVYTSADVAGVELGGALKNVVALGAGVVDGLGIGQNAKAAFMTRGLAEMIRLGVAAGANPLTFGGLSGLGDLIATCESPLSRNRTFGEQLGRGVSQAAAEAGTPHVVEGLTTARAALDLAAHYRVEMPIAETVVNVLDGHLTVQQAIGALMSRIARPELDGAS